MLILPVPTPPQNGGPVTQGDLRQITPDSDEVKINEVLGYTGPDILLGDIISDAETLRFITQDPNSRNAITYPHGLWPSNTVPYIIDRSIGQQGVKAINDAIKDYHSQTCLKFVSRTTQRNYIRFTVGGGCSSSVGRTARGEQKINLHRNCWFKGVVIHEIAHAIGFFHEQSRSDRNSYVKILYENIEIGKENNFDKFNQGEIQHLGEPYDYSSIMHYGPDSFTRNGRPTIMGLRSGSNQMGQRKGFSANDVRQINKLYKCPAKPVAPGPDENSVEYCNFDSGSLCDFTQATGDQFDWTLHKGSTRSGGTGPSTDMSGKGYYVYIETSNPRREGDRAVLLSPRLTGPYCLRMHFHMLGANIGSLRVYKNSASGNSVVFSVDGNKGDQWYSAEYSLTGPEQFQLAFEAVRGNGYRGDIALDEIKLVPGKCNASPGTPAPPVIKTPAKQKTTPEPPTRGEVQCNFDTRTLCQFTQTTADEFDWVLNKGITSSAPETGPRSDVSSTGYYIYAEASFPRQNGDRAQLFSPKLIGDYCLQFYYYMYGAQMGALHVVVLVGAQRTKLGSITGDRGQKWYKVDTDIRSAQAYQIVFEAERGIGYTGDIALDEIRLKPGKCNQFRVPTQPPTTIKTTPLVTQAFSVFCNFDSRSLCRFTQDNRDEFDWTLNKGVTGSNPSTGPTADLSGNGYYIYAEASNPRRPGDRARLLSPVVTGRTCVAFRFNMHGRDMGTLNVYGKVGPMEQVMWEHNTDRGDTWESMQINVETSAQFQVVFEAIRGKGYRSDIALDEISIYPGPCITAAEPLAPTTATLHTTSKITPLNDLRCLSGWTKFGRSCYKSFDAKMLWHAAKAHCQRDGASLVAINDAYELNFVRNLTRRIYGDYAVWIGLRRDSQGEFSRWENGEPLAYTKWFKNEPDNLFGDENCVEMFKYTGRWMDSTCTGVSARSHPFICESELEKSKPQCPPGWDELSTACYKVYSGIRGMSPWADASKVCQASRASLVSITSPDERKEVLSLMQRYSEGMYGYWIGLKRSFSSTFSWEDKSPLTYTKWARGEPNNWIRNEDCVYMSTQDGTWFDSRCSRYLPFICKLSLARDRPTDPTTPLPVTCGVKMNETSISSGLAVGVVVGGKVAIPGAWPWQVALLCKTCTDPSCGGTLISAYHVITAAHCIPSDTDTFVKDYKIRLGEHDIRTNETDEQDIDIAAVYRHASYGVTAPHDSDIAVIKLASPATFSSSVGPACLQSNNIDFPPDTECVITGWGRTRRRGGASSVLREARVPLVGEADCKKNYRPELITSNMICAGNLGGGIDACRGDSGGPLVCEKDGRWHLVGTTSWGWGCGGQYYGVYTNIAELYEWIKENMK